MSAVAGHSALVFEPVGGGPCTPQLDPEHCGELIVPGLSALPPPQAMRNGAVAKAIAKPLVMACDMLLSPFMYLWELISLRV
jgi:hypothetical protein